MLQASFTRQSTWPSQADAVGLPFCPRIPLGELGNCYWVLLANTDWIGSANNPQRQREGKNPLFSAGSCVEKQALCGVGRSRSARELAQAVRWSWGALRGDGRQANHTSCAAVVLCSWGELQAHSGRLSRCMGGHWCCFSRTVTWLHGQSGDKNTSSHSVPFQTRKKACISIAE